MTTSYRLLRETPQRVSCEPCYLTVPLSERLVLQYRVKESDLPLVAAGILYLRDPASACVTALSEDALRKVWDYRQGLPGSVRAVGNGFVVAWVDTDHLDLVHPRSGVAIGEVRCPGGSHVALIGKRLVGQTWQDGSVLHSVDLDRRAVDWEWRPSSDVRISSVFCADADAVYFGLSDGLVVALGLRDGRELWRSSVADVKWDEPPRNGEPQGVAWSGATMSSSRSTGTA